MVMNKYNVDLNRALLKPLYLGLAINVFFPSIMVLIVYYIDSGAGTRAPISGTTDLLLWFLAVFAVLDGAAAIYLRHRLMYAPMISSKESFAEDFYRRVATNSIIAYALCAAIAIYGLAVYFIFGKFDYLLLFVILSFIAFQIVRPRAGFMNKVLAAQEEHVEQGRFAPKR